MIHSTIRHEGETTLPEEVQDALELRAGQKLVYRIQGKEVVVSRHPGVMASCGSLNVKSEPWNIIRKLTRKDWADHASKEGSKR